MKALIIYDSTHGNTQMVAQAMGNAIGGRAFLVGEVKPADLSVYDLVIIGSHTHGGFPIEGIHNQKNAAHLLAPPEGFFVLDTKGPLLEGELERAVMWAKGVVRQY